MILLAIIQIVLGQDECAQVTDITYCNAASPYCMIVPSGSNYQYQDEIGEVLDFYDDKCRSLNFWTSCYLINNPLQCVLGSCIWDPIRYTCFEWGSAPCNNFMPTNCRWNPDCATNIYNMTLELYVNFTLLNNVDTIQYDGRSVGSLYYDFGLITQAFNLTSTTQSYTFNKCQLKNICDLVVGQSNCEASLLNCYYSQSMNKCLPLSHSTNCADVSSEVSCNPNNSPCIWIVDTCRNFNDADTPCSELGKDYCLMNENCYILGLECVPYASCSDNLQRIDCDNSLAFNCYFDPFFQTCNLITVNTPCQYISQQNCQTFDVCEWKNNVCSFINPITYCSSFTNRIDCTDPTKTVRSCIWDGPSLTCKMNDYNSMITNCALLTDCTQSPSCYFDSIVKGCWPVIQSTPCQFQQQNSCGLLQSICVWQYNDCLLADQADCTLLLTQSKCGLNQKCFWNGSSCAQLRQCDDNLNIVDDCLNDPLNCYFDYSLFQCRRSIPETPCSQIFTETSCNQAFCVWNSGKCYGLEQINCINIPLDKCQFSLNCYLAGSQCLPYEPCRLNDGNELACQNDNNHCYYNSTNHECDPINGNTLCSDIIGGANCQYGTCVLQPGTDLVLKCLEYSNSDCQYLTSTTCNFGQCRWNSTSSSCFPYPPLTNSGNSTSNSTTNSTTNSTSNPTSNSVNQTVNSNSTNTTNTTNTADTNTTQAKYIIILQIGLLMIYNL